MGKVKESIQNVYDECQALYEKGGVQAVCDHVIAQQIANNPMYEEVKYGYCTPCEAGQPCLNNICLVCGSSLTEIKPVVSAPDVSIGKPIYRVAELRYLIEGLDDNDLICIETCDEHGDVQDLYPMYIDVIENVRLTDGSIVREVRFCQMPNTEPKLKVESDDYFKVTHTGFCKDAEREEVRIHAGENGNIVLFQDGDKLGFIVDVYGQTDHVDSMTIWEEDLADEDDV